MILMLYIYIYRKTRDQPHQRPLCYIWRVIWPCLVCVVGGTGMQLLYDIVSFAPAGSRWEKMACRAWIIETVDGRTGRWVRTGWIFQREDKARRAVAQCELRMGTPFRTRRVLRFKAPPGPFGWNDGDLV